MSSEIDTHDLSAHLRVSVYPRALVYQKVRLGLVNEWWVLILSITVMFYLFNIAWQLIISLDLILLVLGVLATRWDTAHIKLYRQYSRQGDAYEAGFKHNQTRYRRPEGMGRSFPG